MTGPYDDIINLPHHTSPTRSRMATADRAAQFSPFAALTGYEAAVQETARLTDQKVILDEDERAILDQKQRILMERITENPDVTVTYFLPDQKKNGGAYITHTGALKKIESVSRMMIFTDGVQIPLDDISDLGSSVFGKSEWTMAEECQSFTQE